MFEYLQTQNSQLFMLLLIYVHRNYTLFISFRKLLFLFSLVFFCFLQWEIIIFEIPRTALFGFRINACFTVFLFYRTDFIFKFQEIINSKIFFWYSILFYEKCVDKILFLLLQFLLFLSESYLLIFGTTSFLIDFVKFVVHVICFEIQKYCTTAPCFQKCV